MNRKNHAVFEGNLVSDPKVNRFSRTNKEGNEFENVVTSFRLAVDGGRTGYDKETAFLDFEGWDSGAERLADLRKGDCVLVEAIARNDNWVDKAGKNCSRVIFRVSHFTVVKYVENTDDFSNKTEANTERAMAA